MEMFLDIQKSAGIMLITINITEFLMRVFRSFLSRMKMPAKHAKKRLIPAQRVRKASEDRAAAEIRAKELPFSRYVIKDKAVDKQRKMKRGSDQAMA